MDKIQIYTDETFGDNNNYFITSSVFGSSSDCSDFQSAILDIRNKNLKVLGSDFKGFHASKLGVKNWSKISPIFTQVIETLKQFIVDSRLGLLVHLESKAVYEKNSTYIENFLKTNVLNKDGLLGENFQHISETDLIAIYRRAPKIYNYLLHREKFGKESQEFEYFPDSSGKILNYKNLAFKLQTTSKSESPGVTAEFPFYDIIKITTNGLVRGFIKTGWNTYPYQHMSLFEPIPDEQSYVLQAADMISNLVYNLVKKASGSSDDLVVKKASLLTSNGLFHDIEPQLATEFEIKEGKTVAKSDTLKHNIELNFF
jgi:hypothetical protein